jgi:hypothetical protein
MVDVIIDEKEGVKNRYSLMLNGKEICICSSKRVAEYIQEIVLHDFDYNNEDYVITMLQKLTQ